jgi:hypothetical protein
MTGVVVSSAAKKSRVRLHRKISFKKERKFISYFDGWRVFDGGSLGKKKKHTQEGYNNNFDPCKVTKGKAFLTLVDCKSLYCC